jgi:methylmalonyl-CoA mutase N-terminal domain/subunit
VETLTTELEREAEALFEQIEEIGGVVRGLETGWLQRRINESAARQQWEIEQHRRVIVGVNEFVTDEPELKIETLKITEETERDQKRAMAAMRARRDDKQVREKLEALTQAAASTQNLMPFILDCARVYCTLYEIRAAMEKVFGAYREPVFF